MKHIPQSVQREFNARIERQEIQQLIDTQFEPIERKVFYTAFYFVLATIVIIPTVISLI